MPRDDAFQDITINGNATLTTNARVTSDVLPSPTATHDLGSPSNRWSTIYANTVDAAVVGATVTGYNTLQEEGVALTQRNTLNFIGGALTAADNVGSARTDLTLSASPDSASVVGIGRTISTSGAALTGGGDLSANRTITLSASPDSASVVGTGRTISTGTGLTGGGDLSANRTLSVVADSTVQQVEVSLGGVLTGTRRKINFIQGNDIQIDVVDDAIGNEVDVTVASTFVGGAVSTQDDIIWTGEHRFDLDTDEVAIATTLSDSCTPCTNQTLGSTDDIDAFRFMLPGDQILRLTKLVENTIDLDDATLPQSQKANGIVIGLESSVAATGGNPTGQKLVSPLTIKTQVNSDADTTVPHLGVQSIMYSRNAFPAEHAAGYFFALSGLSPTDANASTARIWGIDSHCFRPNASQATTAGMLTTAIEIGIHNAVTYNASTNESYGLHIISDQRDPAPGAARAGHAIGIDGDAGWTNFLRILDTDGTLHYTLDQNFIQNHIGQVFVQINRNDGSAPKAAVGNEALFLARAAGTSAFLRGPIYSHTQGGGGARWDWAFDPDQNATYDLMLRRLADGDAGLHFRDNDAHDTVIGGTVAIVPSASADAYTFPSVNEGDLILRRSTDAGAIFFGTDASARNFLSWSGSDFQFQTATTGNLLISALTGAAHLQLGNGGSHIRAGGDVSGTITLSGATSGSHAFSVAYATAPAGIAVPQFDIGGVDWWVTTSTSAITVNTASSVTGSFFYMVIE